MKKTSYYKARKELLELGYLVPIKEDSNILNFFEYPVRETNSVHLANKSTKTQSSQNELLGSPNELNSSYPDREIQYYNNTINIEKEKIEVEDMRKTMTMAEIEKEFADRPYYRDGAAVYFEDSEDVILIDDEAEHIDAAALNNLTYGKDYKMENGLVVMLATGKRYLLPAC